MHLALASDPDDACAVVHALNQWMHEHWTFVYSDAIFASPVISLAVLDKAMAELEFVAERGANPEQSQLLRRGDAEE